MGEERFPVGWIVVDHMIPGVTEEMVDWWWVNMEKGYELWCPDEHKGFRWEIKPPMGGHIERSKLPLKASIMALSETFALNGWTQILVRRSKKTFGLISIF